MTVKTIQKPSSKLAGQNIRLDLNNILKQTSQQGLPNGISNVI
ncbi:MAG: hypothetical protein AAGE96_05540 [Cyanobacteria bacterium P01_G01_bin.19]